MLDNLVFNKVKDIKNVVGSDLKTFIFNNNILGTMSAVTIAFSTGTMIRSLVGFTGLSSENLSKFLKEFISWLIVIFITFIFVDYVLKKFVWTPEQSKKEESKKEESKKQEPKKEEPKKEEPKKEEPNKGQSSKEEDKMISIEQFYNSRYSMF